MHYFSCPFSFCNHLEEEEGAGCFAFIVFLMSCYYKCSVALPHGALGWSTYVSVVFPDNTQFVCLFVVVCLLFVCCFVFA